MFKRTLKKLNQKQEDIKIYEEFQIILKNQIKNLLEQGIDKELLNRSFPLQCSDENFNINTLYGINKKFSILYLTINIKNSLSLNFKKKLKISIELEKKYYEQNINGNFISELSLTKVKLYKIEKNIKKISKYDLKLILDFPDKLDKYLSNKI